MDRGRVESVSNIGTLMGDFEALLRTTLMNSTNVNAIVADRIHATGLPDLVKPTFPLVAFEYGSVQVSPDVPAMGFCDLIVQSWVKTDYGGAFELSAAVSSVLDRKLVSGMGLHVEFTCSTDGIKVVDPTSHALGVYTHYIARMVQS